MSGGPRQLLVLDMDRVLVEPAGYQRALERTVELVSAALGLPPLRLAGGDVELLEAAGATSEWDAAAICAAALQISAWHVDPARDLPAAPPLPAAPRLTGAPDAGVALRELLARLGAEEETRDPCGRACARLLADNPQLSAAQRARLAELLAGARWFERSPTHRLFQELVVGSAVFAEAYGARPTLDLERGYILEHDRSGLTPDELAALRAWLAGPRRGAAVFTARPSRSPDGRGGTPEGEQGAAVAGLPEVPIVGLGGLRWIARQRGDEDLERFLKPSPAHALAAMAAAAELPLTASLTAAAALAAEGQGAALWSALDGAEVYAFEDGDWGLRSAAAAAELLARQGISVALRLCGVTPSAAKAARLRSAGAATVSDTLGAALRAAGVLAR